MPFRIAVVCFIQFLALLQISIGKDNKDDWLDLTYIYETSGLLTIMSDKSVSLDRVEGAPSIIFDKELNKNKYYYFKQLEIERDIIDYRDSYYWTTKDNY